MRPASLPLRSNKEPFVSRILDRVADRTRQAAFLYRDWGTPAAMGRSSAVAYFGWLKLRGFVEWIVWAIVHIWYVIDFRNRVRVLNWMWLYLTLLPVLD